MALAFLEYVLSLQNLGAITWEWGIVAYGVPTGLIRFRSNLTLGKERIVRTDTMVVRPFVYHLRRKEMK